MNIPTSHHTDDIKSFRQREKRRAKWLLLFFILTVCTLVLDVATGPSLLPPEEVIRSLLNYGERDLMTDSIVRGLRLPIALMALAVGASLGPVVLRCKPC